MGHDYGTGKGGGVGLEGFMIRPGMVQDPGRLQESVCVRGQLFKGLGGDRSM